MATRAVSGAIIPGIQIGSAGVTFLGWVYLSRATTQPYQIVPVQAFSTSAILALIVTLGIPYTAPNSFRDVDSSRWRGRGPWSPMFSTAVAFAALIFLIGDVIALPSSHVEPLQVASASLTSGALAALSILCLQITRITSDLLGMFIAALAGPIVPASWIVLNLASFSVSTNVFVFSLVETGMGLILLHRIRPMLMARLTLRSVREGRFLGRALLMVPHLFAFSILMQGMRLTSIVLDRHHILLQAHDLMLIIAIGTTLIIGFHALISVRMQSSGDLAYSETWWRFALQYGILGMISSVVALVVLVSAPRGLPDLPSLSAASRVALCSTLPSIAAYYSLSTQCLRVGKTLYLAITSVSVVAFYYALSIAMPAASIQSAIYLFASAALMMPVALSFIMLLRPDHLRGALVSRGLALTSIGYLPCLAVLGVAALLAVT